MTKKKSQGLEQDPKPASKKPSIERQSVDVTITLESPDFFANLDTCTTSEYVATDSVIIAYSKEVDGEGGRHFYQLFEQNGKRIKGIWVPFSLTLRDVISRLGNVCVTGSQVDTGRSGDYRKIDAIVQAFPEYLRPEIVSRFDATFGATTSVYWNNLTEGQKKTYLANPRARLARSVDGASVLVEYNDKTYSMPLRTDAGASIDSDKLGFVVQEVDKNTLKAQTNTHIPDTDLSIHSERGVIQIVHEHKDSMLHNDACADFAVDPLNSKRVYYAVPGTNELRVIDTSSITESHVPVTPIKLPIQGEIKEFNIDPNGNFFLVLMKQPDGTVLHILERDKLTTVKIVSDVKENIQLDSIGTVYFIDTNNRLRAAHTNFLSYEKGGLQKAYEDRRKKLLDLQAKIKKGILLPDVAASDHIDPAHAQEDSLVVKIASEIDALFDPLIAGAQTLADVDKQSDQVAALKVSAES